MLGAHLSDLPLQDVVIYAAAFLSFAIGWMVGK